MVLNARVLTQAFYNASGDDLDYPGAVPSKMLQFSIAIMQPHRDGLPKLKSAPAFAN